MFAVPAIRLPVAGEIAEIKRFIVSTIMEYCYQNCSNCWGNITN